MPEYRIQAAKTTGRNGGSRPAVTMSLAAFERLEDKLIKLSHVEAAARVLSNSMGDFTMTTPSNPLMHLRKALRAYDGWEDEDGAVAEAIEEMKQIIKDLEARDAEL